MARASSVDSTWVGELASGVSIGGSTLTLADATGTNWPSGSGVFGVQVGEDPDDDAELCQVTRSGTTLTLDASTLTKAHDAGASVYHLTTAADINDKATVASVALKANDADVVHDTGNETVAGTKTFSSPMVMANQTGTTTGYRFGASSCGIFGSSSGNRIGLKAGNQVVFDADGNNASITVQTYPLKAEAGFSGGLYDLTDGSEVFVYVTNGATQIVTDTTGAVALQMGDDLTDPDFVAGLGGAQVTIKDASDNGTGSGAGTNNITITDAGSLPIDGGTTVTIDTDGGFVEITPCDGFWAITGGIGFTLT